MYKDLAAYGWSEKPGIAIRAWKSNSSLSSITAIQARWASGPWLSRVTLFKEKEGIKSATGLSATPTSSTVREVKDAVKLWLLVHSLCPITSVAIAVHYTQV